MLMIPPMGEFYTHANHDFDIRRGMPPEDVLSERLRFVKAMRWFPSDFHDDWDRYDNETSTYHFARRDDSGSIITAMRLTPVESAEDSLSFGMVGANPGMQEAVSGNHQVFTDSKVWDLTRLVFPLDTSHDPKVVQNAMIELFGMAARVSAGELDHPDQDVHWIFTTTPWIIRFFKKTGIEHKILASGKLPDIDGMEKTTLFCAVDVAAAIESLSVSEKHGDTYRHLQIGAREAETGVVYA